MSDRQAPFDELPPWGAAAETNGAHEPAAYLPPPLASLHRDRSWEKAQRTGAYCQISYRKIPTAIRDEIRRIAQDEHYVRADDVARIFLEYALDAYQAGKIEISPVLVKGKLTLFPAE